MTQTNTVPMNQRQTRLERIPLDQIRVNPVALRDADRTSEGFKELTDSIRNEGVITPVSVREKTSETDQKRYELIDGLQRFTASLEANLPDIPAQILNREDSEVLLAQVIANAQKIETKPTEYAKGILRILAFHPFMTEAELASRLGKSPAWISLQLRLNKLDEQIKKLVDGGQINLSNAYAIAKLPPEEQHNWTERAMTMDPNQFVGLVQERVKQIRDSNRKGEKPGEEQFTPVSVMRKKADIEAEIQSNTVAARLTADLPKQHKGAQLAAIAFQLGLKWALNLDPEAEQQQRMDWEARKKKAAEDKARREQERTAKRAQEATEKANKARQEMESAQQTVNA